MRRYLSPGWLLGHSVALVLFVACLALGWWQVIRAGEGNAISYAYAVEWPVFAGFVAFVWYREVRRAGEQPDTGTTGPDAPAEEPASAPAKHHTTVAARTTARRDGTPADDGDDEVAAYNRMLAWLNANPGRRISDYPG